MYAVPKSATSLSKDRPKAQQHYDSMGIEAQGVLAPPNRILLVDDFVARGATLIGACSRIVEAYPEADVRGFAAVRTMTGAEIDNMLSPVVGEIRLDALGESHRAP